jgi:pSer/pThr/pTyr-binding forkhead associated (FHA) protein
MPRARRHARLSLDGQRAVLSDLGSRNGTWVCGVRTERPVVLRSGDEIRLGPFRLSLNAWPMAGTTQDNDVAAPVAWRPSFDRDLAAASA